MQGKVDSRAANGGKRRHFMPACAWLRSTVAAILCAALVTPPLDAIELKKPTLDAFFRYVRIREAQIEQEVKLALSGVEGHQNPFLWIDTLPEARRAEAYAALRRGEVFIERRKTLDNGKEIECPDGLIHHWMGTVFIPGTTLEKTIALVQDYGNHATNYKPDVIASKTLERKGNDFKIFMRFKKKKVLTVVLNTHQDVRYVPLSPTRMHSVARTTRVAQVEDPATPDGPEKAPGKDRGFMWQLYTYWLFEERDGGVYVQCEAISLSRDVPFLLGWLKDYITSVPHESLRFTLGRTCNLLRKSDVACLEKEK